MVPGTEFVRDREIFNYCEEFSINDGEVNHSSTASDAAKKLFGEDSFPEKNSDPKNKFNSLFDD